MKRLAVLLTAVTSLALTGGALAAENPKLETFGPGEVEVTGDDEATIINDANEYGGVYLQSRSQSGKPLSEVDFSFTSTGDVAGGAPRFSIPIDTNGDGKNDGYAFIDAANCGGTSGAETLVSTESSTCQVFFGSATFANWDAFAAANPTYRIAPGDIPFIVADVAGKYEVEDIELR